MTEKLLIVRQRIKTSFACVSLHCQVFVQASVPINNFCNSIKVDAQLKYVIISNFSPRIVACCQLGSEYLVSECSVLF